MPAEPQIFSLENFIPGTKIFIRAVGLGRLVRMWRQLSGHCSKETEKADVSLALWERRHWLQQSSLENAILAFRKACDPRDTIPLLRSRALIVRLRDWCTDDDGPPEHPTVILLAHSCLQYSIEALDWAPQTLDWSRELRVLDAKQPWRNCWVDAPDEHLYNTLFAPCNTEIPLFVPTARTRKAITAQVVVDPSLPEADTQTQWVQDDPGLSEAGPEEPVDSGDTAAEASENMLGEESKSEETCEALNEDSFSFSRGSATSTAGSLVVSPSPAKITSPTEDPSEEIVLAPFDMSVHAATRQSPASD
ncbi:hypothetical protein PHMEG_00010860 [Phytophthora megakarya]|uniref:Uncharacterized protein n=1 Tax=Phytophthora megakarya TaxID=4795 RepID=A0A225WE15_9STRA|nr:hypothetical protein PHMEG_00010860 [Phytophthora megakarya]